MLTPETPASAQRSAAAAAELSAQSQSLRDIVHRLAGLVDGQARAGPSSRTRSAGR